MLVFRLENDDWKIVHSGISIPYSLVREGEVYPIQGLRERTSELEALVEERIRALAEANDQLEILSDTGSLTGIANRRQFDRMISLEWLRAQCAHAPIALIKLDINLFKHFNDQYGHLAGDACLRSLAPALACGVRRAGDLVARYGGEEFAVLLPNANGLTAVETPRLIQYEVSALALEHEGTSFGIVTVSLGVASMMPTIQQVPEELIQQADSALYRAKLSGRNCLHFSED